MIYRQNWLDVKSYIQFQVEVMQVDPASAKAFWSRLRHLIVWADDKPFGKAGRVRPTFPAYIEGRTTRQGKPFTAAGLDAVYKTTRNFFSWAKIEYPTRYKTVEQSFVQSLRTSRARSEAAVIRKREVYTLEDVMKLVSVPAKSTAERRLRAGVAFLFLSGMRVGAFVTLPINCVNLRQNQIIQDPGQGVHTKNSKAGVTHLLGSIPELLGIVEEWDGEIRMALPGDAYWYAHLDRFGELTTEKPKGNRYNSRHDFRDSLVALCERAGVEYLSPHKLRHGFTVYAYKRATTRAQTKAVSQNLMHSDEATTDRIYAKLTDDDVKDIISSL